jgi:hypothetical protein
MPRNYDTTVVGVPYVRIDIIGIEYAGPAQGAVDMNEVLAVKLADGSITKLQEFGGLTADISPAVFAEVFPIISPDTGQPIPGQQMTGQQIMLGILAFCRKRQMQRDLAEQSPAPQGG